MTDKHQKGRLKGTPEDLTMKEAKTQIMQEVQEMQKEQKVQEFTADRAALILQVKEDLAKASVTTRQALFALKELIEAGRLEIEGEEGLALIEEWIQQNDEAPERGSKIAPFIADELETLRRRPGYENITLYELYLQTIRPPEDGGDEFTDLLSRAEAHAEAAGIASLEVIKATAPAIKYKPGYDLHAPTDKFADVFFSIDAPAPRNSVDGQISFAQFPTEPIKKDGIPLRYEGKGNKAKKDITLYYDYFYNDKMLQQYNIEREATDYDYFVTLAADNLFREGNTKVSFTKFWHEMGNTGSPSPEQLKIQLNAIIKGMATTVCIEGTEVREAWKKDGKALHIISPALPVKIGYEQMQVGGNITDGIIEILSYSPFNTLAQLTGHESKWPKEILSAYKGRRTPRYYSVLRYLIREIGWMIHGGRANNNILYTTLYRETGSTTKESKRLTKTMFFRLLDEVFITTGKITAYKEKTDGEEGVEIFPVRTAIPAPKTQKPKKTT